MSSKNKTNRLINEKSDYLLQHAYNPIEWFSWNEEALNKAKREEKPIFLSIGYATCHWCHVMNKESFENLEVAEILNNNYIAIKVDKEDRPDINYIYMTVCQCLTGHTGWPLTIIMTPDGIPFYVATYVPLKTKYNRLGLIDLLKQLSIKWNDERDQINKETKNVLRQLNNHFSNDDEFRIVLPEIIDEGFRELKNSYEPEYGGFTYAPKFPVPHKLMFLLQYYEYSQKREALDMVEHTLRCMYQGGIFDHIEGGFCRYSIDKRWLSPHFEKMLYDNALLIIVYLECYKITNDTLYKEVAEKSLDYVINNLCSKEGGFYSSQDSDSQGEEGKYYLLTYEEVINLLGEVEGKKFNEIYNIIRKEKYDEKNIPNTINSKIDVEEDTIKIWIDKVKKYRKERMKLHTEPKILTSWNGMMIVALSKAYYIFKQEKYLVYAKKALEYIMNKLIDNSGRVMVGSNNNVSEQKGFLDDYAYLIYGLINIYEVTLEKKYLDKALELNERMIELFYDTVSAGCFLYGKDSEKLIARPKELVDADKPCGNSVVGYNLIKLSRLTNDLNLNMISERQMNFIASNLHGGVSNYSFFLFAACIELQK